jgi:hypothetical protein
MNPTNTPTSATIKRRSNKIACAGNSSNAARSDKIRA